LFSAKLVCYNGSGTISTPLAATRTMSQISGSLMMIVVATTTWSTKLGEPMGGEAEAPSVRTVNATIQGSRQIWLQDFAKRPGGLNLGGAVNQSICSNTIMLRVYLVELQMWLKQLRP
jgi:hypothetical protein